MITAAVAASPPKFNATYPNIYEAATSTTRQAKVLYWHDADEVNHNMFAQLVAEGFDVTNGGLYYSYVGTDFSAYDCVIWLEGKNFGNPLQAGVDAALAAYVAAGGGLVRCGYGIWWASTRPTLNPACFAISPVGNDTVVVNPYDLDGGTWNVGSPKSLARGMASAVASTGGYTLLTARAGTIVVASINDARVPDPVPAIAYTRVHGGTCVHINDGLCYPTPARVIEPDVKRAYFNAVWMAAQRHAAPYPYIYDTTTLEYRVPNVLVLDDRADASGDGSGVPIIPALIAEGFNVTDGNEYYNYVGVDFSAFDCVLWLEGRNYGNPLEPDVDAALVAYVAAGGGLIRTGWGLWYHQTRLNVASPTPPNPLCFAISPVSPAPDSAASIGYGQPNTAWTLRAGPEMLRYGLPDSFVTTSWNEINTLRPGAVSLADTVSTGIYLGSYTGHRVSLLSYTRKHGGCSMHVNDSLKYDTPRVIEAEAMQVLFNAVRFAAQRIT